jgi:hypothetical protein
VIVGAGHDLCAVLAVGAGEHHTVRLPDGTLDGAPDWGAYTVDPTALRHGASVDETTDADQACARFPELEPTPYREGWLPGR